MRERRVPDATPLRAAVRSRAAMFPWLQPMIARAWRRGRDAFGPSRDRSSASALAARAVSLLLLAVIACQIVEIARSVLSPALVATLPGAPQPTRPSARAASSDYRGLAAAHLFGEAQEDDRLSAHAPPVAAAPDTALTLTLTGILYAGDGAPSSAIITSDRGREQVYEIGADIGSVGAKLHAVYPDRVILEHAGRLETLRQALNATRGTSAAPRPAVAGAEPRRARLGDVLQASPYHGAEFTGLQVAPLGDAAAFEALGFRANDVITAIDGELLGESSDLANLSTALLEASHATLDLMRAGALLTFVVDTATTNAAD